MTAENALENMTFDKLKADWRLSVLRVDGWPPTDFKAKGVAICADYDVFGDMTPQFFTLADPTVKRANFDNAWKNALLRSLENDDTERVIVEISPKWMPLLGGYIVIRIVSVTD